MKKEIFNFFGKNNSKDKSIENQNNSFQNWLNIKSIEDSKITLNTGKALTMLKISPINFNLKSNLEQKAILNSYRIFLKNLNSQIQIIVSSKKTDVSSHLDEILKNTKENPPIYEMRRDYINLINNIIEQRGTITKDFYIIIPYSNNITNEIIKITETLTACGNCVEECSKEDIIFLLKNFLNKRMINNCNYY